MPAVPAETPSTAPLSRALLEARARARPLMPEPGFEAAVPDDETACALAHAQGVALGAWTVDQVPGFWKSGGPARGARLTHAPLLPSGVVAVAEGGVADLQGRPFFWPRVEAEVALRLGRPVDPAAAAAVTPETSAALVDALALSIEVVDSRWAAGAAVAPALQLADFQVHGALALGPWQAFGPWADHDWSSQTGTLWIGDDAPRAFRGSHPLGSPLWGLGPWLRHLTRHGQTVPAGTVVTTGSWSGCLPVARGQTVRIAFDGLGALALAL
jgi:hypothetical protein